MLSVGEQFPDFSLAATVSTNKDNAFKTITNEDYKGKWKVFFFWPKDFTFVCPTEMAAFGKLNKEFQGRDAQILGGSIDSEFVHLAWRNNHSDLKDLPYPMLSDIKRDLCSTLGILDEKAGVAQRATFIVDPENVIRFVYVTDLSVATRRRCCGFLTRFRRMNFVPATGKRGRRLYRYKRHSTWLRSEGRSRFPPVVRSKEKHHESRCVDRSYPFVRQRPETQFFQRAAPTN
jgi:alkyl hydroperoxide reductase subunit AhpC